ncbi:MAG: pantetheine-phosphate adenylyltransferase [Patescibacteria group bacterium]
MTTRKAVYAGSFDPITNGHINIVERAARLFDEVVVVVSVASSKHYTFCVSERVLMVKQTLSHLQNVSVHICTDQYVVSYAYSIGATTLVRGLRNSEDLVHEQVLAEENRNICPEVETVLIPCIPNLMHVSSSMVRGHVGADRNWEAQVSRSVPDLVVQELKKKFILGKARAHWARLMSEIGNPTGSEKILLEVLSRYSESHRAYHDLIHIVNMLDELDLIVTKEGFSIALRLAIWYHDVVYETKSKDHPVVADNEERSAYKAQLDMEQMGLPCNLIQEVKRLILVTKHADTPSDHDAKLLMDLDLMILGKTAEEFDEYEAGIRIEYEWVPETTFSTKRAQILQSFLNRKMIYSTPIFQEKYEGSARTNLERSVSKLS